MATYEETAAKVDALIESIKKDGVGPHEPTIASLKNDITMLLGVNDIIAVNIASHIPLDQTQSYIAVSHPNAQVREKFIRNQPIDGSVPIDTKYFFDILSWRLACDDDVHVREAIIDRASSDERYVDIARVANDYIALEDEARNKMYLNEEYDASDFSINTGSILKRIQYITYAPALTAEECRKIQSDDLPLTSLALLVAYKGHIPDDIIDAYVSKISNMYDPSVGVDAINAAAFWRGMIQNPEQTLTTAMMSGSPTVQYLAHTYPTQENRKTVERIAQASSIPNFQMESIMQSQDIHNIGTALTAYKGTLGTNIIETAIRSAPSVGAYTTSSILGTIGCMLGMARCHSPRVTVVHGITCPDMNVRSIASMYPLIPGEIERRYDQYYSPQIYQNATLGQGMKI